MSMSHPCRESSLVSDLESEGSLIKDVPLEGDHVMKLIAAITFLAIAGAATAGRALSTNTAVRTTVPFNFSAGDKQLPSGTYTISRDSSGIIRIQNRDKHVDVYMTATPGNNEAANSAELIFRKYGEQYFLKEVLASQSGLDARIPTWKLEKKAQQEAGKSVNEIEAPGVQPSSN
jgi:hypothetical protein